MIYNFNGKSLKIPDEVIAKAMKNLDLTQDEAIQMWLEDEGHLDNEEQLELCHKAKDNRITATIHQANKGKKVKKEPRPKVASAEKVQIFNKILDFLTNEFENVEVLNENKLIHVKINDKIIKIDLIEQKKPKK
jgi:hypothetical protein